VYIHFTNIKYFAVARQIAADNTALGAHFFHVVFRVCTPTYKCNGLYLHIVILTHYFSGDIRASSSVYLSPSRI